MASRWLFLILVAVLAVQRLLEVKLSQEHERRLLARGGREHAPGQFRVMAALHAAWFIAMPLEVILLNRPFLPWLAALAGLMLLAGQALRYTAIHTLGERWTVRVITVPGEAPVQRGIYRFLRHPNYVGVVLEMAAVPLLHSAYVTALAFSLANGMLLAWRIRTEEAALGREEPASTLQQYP